MNKSNIYRKKLYFEADGASTRSLLYNYRKTAFKHRR